MKTGFPTKPLGDACDIIGGGTPSKANSAFYGGDIPWATVRDMHSDFINDTQHKITQDAVVGSSSKIIPAGSVIIATRVGLGKVCIINQPTAINQDLRGIIPKKEKSIDTKFLFYWFQSQSEIIINAGTGATVQGVKLPFVKSLLLPDISLNKQKRIVEVLDIALTKIDRLEAIAKRQIANEKALKGSILDALFESIKTNTKAFTEPLKDLAVLKGRIGWKGLTAKEYTEEGPLFLSVHSLNYGDYVDYRDAFHISQDRYDESPEIMLQKDDILICKDGAGIGKLGVIPELIAPTTINSSLLLIRHGEKIRAKYLYYCLLSPYFQEIVQSRLEGATTPHLYQRDIKDFPVHVCSLNEQDEVIKKLDTIFSKSRKFLEAQRKKLAALSELRQSLLEKAFSGELVDMADQVVKITAPAPANDNYTHHAGAIAYADSYFRNNAPDTFHGRTIFEKVAQAAEAIAGIELGRETIQGMRGPTDDKQREAVEVMASDKDYFSFKSTGGKGVKLQRGRNFNELRLSFEKTFQAEIPALDRFLRLIASMDTRDVEVLSTVHTAWNNYIIEKQAPTDEQIVTAARENWHEEKMKIPRPKFFAAIETLRKKNLVPTGQGKYVGKIAGASFDF